MSSPSANQTHFRWYQDNAEPNTSDALGAEDRAVASWYPLQNIVLRLKFQQDGSGELADINPILYVIRDDLAAEDLNYDTTYVASSDSPYIDDPTYTEERLTASGVFVPGYAYDAYAGSDIVSLDVSQTTEFVWCIKFTNAAKGHNFKFYAEGLGGAGSILKTPSIDIRAGLGFRFHMQS